MIGSAAKQYKRELRKHLSLDSCSRRLRSTLLARFDAMLGTLAEEYPEPAMAQLESAFGTPTQMAQVLLEGTPKEKLQHRRSSFRTMRTVLVTAAVVGLALGLAYVWYFKSYAVHLREIVTVLK